MKNTPTSLDILYLTEAGAVLQIADHTTPFSEEFIGAEQPYRCVLEVLAGTADRISLKVGDPIQLPDF